MSNTTELDPLDVLMDSIDHDYESVEILGKPVKIQPVTIIQSVRLVKRFRPLIALFEQMLEKSGKPLPDELQPNLASIFVDAGPAAVAGLVACGVGREGDAKFEAAFASKPDKLVLPLFYAVVKSTLGGGNLGDFFTKVIMGLVEAGILQIETTSQPDAKAA